MMNTSMRIKNLLTVMKVLLKKLNKRKHLLNA